MADTKGEADKIRIEQISRLKVYEEKLKTRLQGGVPDVEMKAFLSRDLERTSKKIKMLMGV